MINFTLNLRALSQFLINQPTLEIWNDGGLDISALVSYDKATDNINDYVQLAENLGSTILSIDTDGAANGINFIDLAEIDSVTGLDIYTMIAADNLIV